MSKKEQKASAPKLEHFFEDVYAVVRLIPPGRVSSYGAIARYLGRSGSARMVGWALNGALQLPDVPAQRVVNRQGRLTGKIHFGSPTRMQELLEAEGVAVQDDQVVNFAALHWDPEQELSAE
ncbi:MGMT family protein [Cesiribacter andamanensis]|uniref:Methylated-DNA--protein-cysteine methyltransferase n=1 Tax=Cesiribacter andamanensis AMV16 TaxID=1279009 RepID=M7NM52_9BACT|nr:MGMT family protein [Cesiribacter andamanensis]EMR02855.1 Methylated-DNA--protein-cysteine methyltransferase [Cesiribacter andamanensis AMV16]